MEEILGSIYCNNSEKFGTKLMKDVFKTLKAEKHDLGVVMKEKKIGNLYGFSGGNYAGNVYEKNNLCPTINTCQGGGKQPMIIDKPKQLGFMDNGTGKHQSNTVYDEKGICPNITTIDGGGTQQIKIATADAIRMVHTEDGKKLRKQYENHEIKHGFNEFREPGFRKDGCSNTLTSVQKDNMVCVAMRGRNPKNPSDRTPGVHTEQRLEVNQNGTSNTLTSVQKDNLVLEEVSINEDKNIPCKLNKMPTGILSNMDMERVCDIRTPTSSTITARYGYANNCIATQYRIRKLTPRECWRLMDFKDSDFEKAQEVNSNTQLYKQAGNSIVKNVLVAIFGQMIDGKERIYAEI